MCKIFIEVLSRVEAGDILRSSERCSEVTYLVSIGESHDELPIGFENVARRLRFVFAAILMALTARQKKIFGI